MFKPDPVFRTLVSRLNLGTSLLNAASPLHAPPAATAPSHTAPTPPPAATAPPSHVSVRGAALPKLKPLKFGMKTRVKEVQEEEEMGCSPPIQLKERQEVEVEAEIQLVGRPSSPMVAPLPLPAAAPSTNKPKPWQSRFNLRMPGNLRLPSPRMPPMAQQAGKSLARSQATSQAAPPAPGQPAAGGLMSSLPARLGRAASERTQPTAEAPGDSAQPLESIQSRSTGFPLPKSPLQPQPKATFQSQPSPYASSHDAYSQPSTGPPAQASYQPQSYEPQDPGAENSFSFFGGGGRGGEGSGGGWLCEWLLHFDIGIATSRLPSKYLLSVSAT